MVYGSIEKNVLVLSTEATHILWGYFTDLFVMMKGESMRKNLKKLKDEKVLLTGTVERYGLKKEYMGGKTITLCLKNIEVIGHDGEIEVLDHAWIKVGKTLAEKNIPEGSVLKMNAHVKEYLKGYVGFDHEIGDLIDQRTLDYGIQRASKIEILHYGQGKRFNDFYHQAKKQDFISNKYDGLVI